MTPGLPLLTLMRPSQWTKNLVVFAAFFFAVWDRARQAPLAMGDFAFSLLPAFAVFCIVSSGIYIFNDIMDIAADRKHPLKKLRPLAAGAVSVPMASSFSFLMIVSGLTYSLLMLPNGFTAVVASYIGLQVLYTCLLKRIALIDVIVIASGFVLRAIAGAVALRDVIISPWLLLCTFLLALFLGLCKRRHEKILLSDQNNSEHRVALQGYDQRLLDTLVAIAGSATIVSYSIYTLWPQTVEKFGTSGLGLTIPFVVFGIFRYLNLVYRHSGGGRPEKVLLTDIPTLVNIILYGLAALIILSLSNATPPA